MMPGWLLKAEKIRPDLGWHEGWHRFGDHEDRAIECLFKLYPWE